MPRVNANRESQRDSGLKPRVARHELPWVPAGIAANPNGVAARHGKLRAELSDGRIVSAPLAWFPRLQHGTVAERNHWRLIGGGEGINWPDLDEDISVENLLAGQPSGESQKSLQRWLDTRQSKPLVKSRRPTRH